MSRGSRSQSIQLHVENLVNTRANFSLKCPPWTTVQELKLTLHRDLKEHAVQPSQLQIFYKNLELTAENRTLLAYEIKSRSSLSVKLAPEVENSSGLIHSYKLFDDSADGVSGMIESIRTGFSKSIRPKLA